MNSDFKTAEERIRKAAHDKAIVLDLSKLDITVLPESIGQLFKLEKLHLSMTNLKQLPETIGQLFQLKELLLIDTSLQELPESIGQLSQLEELLLIGSQLQQLPESIGQLSQLTILSIAVSSLEYLPESIGQLSQLKSLDLSATKLQQLPASIGQLSQLKSLDLSATKLQQLPASIGQLSQLKSLNLSATKLQQLPASIGQLSQLKHLNLSSTKLQKLPKFIKQLKNIEELYLHGLEALNIPQEILGPTWDDVHQRNAQAANPASILDYYFRLRSGQRPLNEAKLILVGRGGVGKSSLVKQLLFRQFDKDEKKTEGIAISEWLLPLHNSENIRLNLWDFGGQEIMHATHQFFLTQRSLYLLVLEGRQGAEDADAEYWLKLIESFGTENDGNSAPVIVVLNKSSLNPFALNQRALRQKYPFIKGFITTDCETGFGIMTLHAAIAEQIDRLPYLRAAFPSSWFSIKEKLASMADNFISFDQYRALCTECGEKDAESQEDLATHMHNLGVALNYKDDPRLRDTHVLNPRWVTNGVYDILNDKFLLKRNGELRLDDLGRMLDKKRYPRHMHRFLMDLMKKFELCFTFTDDDTHYLIPELLDKQEPEEAADFDRSESLNFEYRYSVLPEGLLPRFIVRTHALSEGQPRWRTGVILSFEGNRALIKADLQDKRVFISVNGHGESRRRLLAVIRSDFERIHTQISKLSPNEMVPIPGTPDMSVMYSKLLTFEKDHIIEFPEAYNGKSITLNVKELLNGVDLSGTRNKRQLPTDQPKVRLFYSYSHKDEYYRNKLETHLKILERTGKISSWHDRNIDAGDDGTSTIDENLERADIILLIVSADFIASDYCWEKEMARALERGKAGEATVIPIIVRDVNWKGAPFAELQALPKDAKAVKLWENEDSAWKNVSEGIEKIVDKLLRKRFPFSI